MSSEDFYMAPMALTGHKSYEDQVAEKFNQLTSLNLNDKVESKNGLSYVSWANAWKAFKEAHSDFDIEPFMKTSQVAGSITISI